MRNTSLIPNPLDEQIYDSHIGNLLGPVIERLGDRATLHVVEEADHSFHVPARSGRTDAAVLQELARRTAEWAAER